MQFAPAHLQRLITGIVLAAILLTGLYMGGWVLLALLIVVASLALIEFYSMFWPSTERWGLKTLGIACGIMILGSSYFHAPFLTLACIMGSTLLLNLQFLFHWGFSSDTDAEGRPKGIKAHFANSQVLMSGMLYIPIMLAPVLNFSLPEQVLIIGACIASDTGGYYAGSLWGKRRIWPRVSPKKSWVGSLGGLVVCLLICITIGSIWGIRPWWHFIFVGLILNIFSQLGDFFESALKRTLNVKDSGKILPGHGGILDRIDSLLFAVPVYAALDGICKFF